MECKQCGRPIFESIEGEVVCSRCWAENQMTDEEREQQRLIKEAQELVKQGLCYVCEEPMNNSPVGHKCWYLA